MTTQTTTMITDAQIQQLMDEAGWHGDYAQVGICEVALTGEATDRRLRDDDRAIVAKFPSRAAARAECARVLADAAAQSE